MKHTPKEMKVSGLDLWSDAPNHSHIRMVTVKQHAAMNGIDSQYIADEMAKRWNGHDELLEALELCLEAIQPYYDHDDDGSKEANASNKALLAIAKAKGQ